jgi:ABC-type branched-subunit amino acid transport system permease subunit
VLIVASRRRPEVRGALTERRRCRDMLRLLITGLFQVVMVIGLALLLHLQLGLARIANFGVVGFWGIGMHTFGVLYAQVDWPFRGPAVPRLRRRRDPRLRRGRELSSDG